MAISIHTKTPNNLPTASADLAAEDMVADADEPPDSKSKAAFTKTACSAKHNPSLLSKMIHTSESDSHVDEDDYAFYEPHRATSSASTYSRSSAVSMTDFNSDTALTSPHSLSQSIECPLIKKPSLEPQKPVAPAVNTLPAAKAEQTLVKKRCITFACGSKEPKAKAEDKVAAAPVAPKEATEPAKRVCSLKFVCPTRTGAAPSKPHVRLSSPPPPSKPAPSTHRQHRDSDATLRTNSPKIGRKHSLAAHVRRSSTASNASHRSAIRFHEFASSEGEEDEWTKEKTCYQARLTIDDTLVKEHNLRKLAKEAEEEEEDDDEDVDDEDAIEDDDDDDEDDEDEDDESVAADEDSEVDSGDDKRDDASSVHSAALSVEVDEGFQTDDELGFAHSEDESDANSDYDWWAPGRTLHQDQADLSRPKPMPRRASNSSIESRGSADRGIPISPHAQRKAQRHAKTTRAPAPELPDSTDFVCGTLDEDRPLEQAYLNHLEQRRAAKHKAKPQDIDPTFPTSDPELEDEEDEDSDHVATESDAHIMVHGEMDEEPQRSRRPDMRRRPSVPSPRRLRSPAPVKRNITKARSPPPTARRARSPAPCAIFQHSRLSSSMPRRSFSQMRARFEEPIDEEDDNTPRFNRQAVDIVMGLERKRARRREKMYEKHCRKAAKTKDKKEVKRGKGAEKMRDLGICLNEYRGRNKIATTRQSSTGEVHMLSY